MLDAVERTSAAAAAAIIRSHPFRPQLTTVKTRPDLNETPRRAWNRNFDATIKMARPPLLLLLAILAVIAQRAISEDPLYMWTKNEIDYESEGLMLVGHVIATFENTRVITECALHCMDNFQCTSFNFDDFQYTCELNDKSDLNNPEDMQANDATTFIRKGTFSIDRVSPFFNISGM